MYLTSATIHNSGPIERLRLEASFNPDGTPKPLIFVGANGSGKTGVLSVTGDALVEMPHSITET